MTADPDDAVVRYDWHWGDGSFGCLDGGPTESHYYEKPGQYTVVLTVTDERGTGRRIRTSSR